MLFTVIIPVYNVERYLHRCVDSVLTQTYSDLEVILVDDGSPDNSPRICDDYAAADSRVKVIHKANGGSSDARNVGTQAAEGEYLIYLDSDDYLAESFFEPLVARISQSTPEAIIFSCYDKIGEKLQLSRGNYSHQFETMDVDSKVSYLFNSGKFPGAAWLFCIKRDFISKQDISFVKGIKSEDYDWVINVFSHLSSLSVCNDSYYVYEKYRDGSISTVFDNKNIDGILYTIDKWLPILAKNQTTVNKYLLNHLFYMYLTTFVLYQGIASEYKPIYLEKLRARKILSQYALTRVPRLGKLLMSILGIRLTSKILYMKHLHKKNKS